MAWILVSLTTTNLRGNDSQRRIGLRQGDLTAVDLEVVTAMVRRPTTTPLSIAWLRFLSRASAKDSVYHGLMHPSTHGPTPQTVLLDGGNCETGRCWRHAGESTMASPGDERSQHQPSASSIVVLPCRETAVSRPSPDRANGPDVAEERGAPTCSATAAARLSKSHPFSFRRPAANRLAERSQRGDGRLGRGGRRVVVEAAALDRGEPLQALRQGAKRLQSPADVLGAQPAAIAAAAAQAALIRLCWPGTGSGGMSRSSRAARAAREPCDPRGHFRVARVQHGEVAAVCPMRIRCLAAT